MKRILPAISVSLFATSLYAQLNCSGGVCVDTRTADYPVVMTVAGDTLRVGCFGN